MFYHLKIVQIEEIKHINKRLCYDRWTKRIWSPSWNTLRTYDNIRKGQGDDYNCLLDHDHFNNYYKMITVDLGKQQVLDTYPKAIKQINFTGNLS